MVDLLVMEEYFEKVKKPQDQEYHPPESGVATYMRIAVERSES